MDHGLKCRPELVNLVPLDERETFPFLVSNKVETEYNDTLLGNLNSESKRCGFKANRS